MSSAEWKEQIRTAMTEADWLTGLDPEWMLFHVRNQASVRKLHLWAVASCTPIGQLLERPDCDPRGNCERVCAEEDPGLSAPTPGEPPGTECHRFYRHALTRCRQLDEEEAEYIVAGYSCGMRSGSLNDGFGGLWRTLGVTEKVIVDEDLLTIRCIFGNPFRPVAFAGSWRTETVVSLAAAIYAERTFDRMPILADALEEAGCDHADILSHCRGPGPHVRGCWVVDLVLGKE